MGSERCYVWSSLSCSSASTTTSLTCAADGMVKMELEAAEALADLAHLAVQESAGSGLRRKWGSKGKRAAKRVKSESPPGDSAFRLNLLDSVPSCSDLAEQDRANASQQQCEKIRPIVFIEQEKAKQVPGITEVKPEQDSELAKPTPNCNRSYAPFVFRKTRRKLTEAEKEEQRIRRVLANRESARQTIRRRQALCEDLTRKAADLARENEYLKRDKELALKEHQSLETTNKHLKQQMAKVRKAVVEETPGDYSADVAASLSSSRNCPWHLYNHPPLLPVLWPSVIQSSNRVQSRHGRQSAIVIPSNMPMPAACRPDTSQEQENRIDVNGKRAPLYVLPCPWFFPLPGPGNRLQPLPSTGMKYEQGETSRSNHNSSSSSKSIAHVENRHCSLPIEVKTEASGSSEARPANDLNETPIGFPLDGVSQHTGANSEEILYTPASLDCSRPASTIKHENMSQSAYAPNIETTSTARLIASALPEKQESAVFPGKKLIDAVAAAGVRKRRKELTKLKNLHGRQCQMHC
ncbi:uncharacterized protein LOC121268576 isoform X1 [Juglans microcarpa x Juglans regia]|uniref:uncharacterized protein LOC121268576 isoform X1 n=1 Tax=Juglans microcarpa x Juglans regia TaxID=2249226 RepID=UPI001B7E5833|nr:uncharacterized protein LOC121268576 isoform X1 [Juglans microcarpa x Juglans regia]